MDSTQAKQLSDSLLGKDIDGWHIDGPIDHGKSAVVVLGSKGTELAAIKVFHPELVERFGRAVQLERITREVSLVGANHSHLVKILGGGECTTTGHLYVAMEYLPWSNLHKRLKDIPVASFKPIISQLASAAMFLEEKNLAHRDIKPENIAISDDLKTIKLLDLGVLRPFGVSDLTDADQRPFIGTLRYSSPEFLRRKEEPTIEGWRAITFYQIGAVLHDLLTGEPLFNEFEEPFTLLVEAVLNEPPKVWGDDQSLIPLCRHCLHKNPDTRLELVKWSDFTFDQNSLDEVGGVLARIKIRQHGARNPGISRAGSQAEIARIAKIKLDAFCNRMESRLSILINSLNCFPSRATTSDRDGANSTCTIHLQFEQSSALGLDGHLHIHVKSDVIDSTGEDTIYKLSVAAEISPNENTHIESKYFTVDMGSADELLSGGSLEATLVRALEAAYVELDINSKAGLAAACHLQLER